MAKPMRIPEGKIVLTYEDYVEIPNDGKRYELLEGELAVTPAPNPEHQAASVNLIVTLSQHIRSNDLGLLYHAPIDLILDATSVLQPDLLFIAKSRQSIITSKGIEGAPDLVIEILSPSTQRNDRITKAQIYARHKITWYWIADPEQRVLEIHRLEADGYRLVTTLHGDSPLAAPPFNDLKFCAKDIFA